MIAGLEEGLELLDVPGILLRRYLVHHVLRDEILHPLLGLLRYPNHPVPPPVRLQELGGPHVLEGNAMEPIHLPSPRRGIRHGGEGNPVDRRTLEVPVDDAQPVHLRDVEGYGLEASAGGVGISESRVELHPGDRSQGLGLHRLVGPLPLPLEGIYDLPYLHLVDGSLGIYPGRRPPVEPAYGPAVGVPLRGDHAHVGGSEGLTEGAAVKHVHLLILQAPGPGIPGLVDLEGLRVEPLHLGGIRVEGDLDLLDDGTLAVVKPDDDGPEVLQAQPLLHRFLAHPAPDGVPLVKVHETLHPVGEVVQPPLEHPLHLLLQILPAHLHQDGEGGLGSLRHVLEVGTHHHNLPVLHLFGGPHPQKLELVRDIGTSQLRMHVPLPYPLPLVHHPHVHGDVREHSGLHLSSSSAILSRFLYHSSSDRLGKDQLQ